nr:DNA polymerase III subunit delta' [Marinobacter zhejiangensis]
MNWHSDAWRFVDSSLKAGRLSHALLVGGERGVGKTEFADGVAALLVCDKPDVSPESGRLAPCGRCKQCELVQAQSHPDIRRFAPEKSRMIRVDQVRALSAFAMASPQVARRKVIVVDRADQLNINAANALLKTLEEPPSDLVLLLLQESGRPILPTLRSRCQTVVLPTPDFATAKAWLEVEAASRAVDEGEYEGEALERALRLAGNAPRLAREYLEGEFIAQRKIALDSFRQFMKNELPLPEASKPFKDLGLDGMLWLLEGLAADLARLGCGGEPRDTEAADMLQYLAVNNPPWRAHELLEACRETRAAGIYNASVELEAERLLMKWQALMPSRRRKAG